MRATLLMYMSIKLTDCECMYHAMTNIRWQMGVHTLFLDNQESAEIRHAWIKFSDHIFHQLNTQSRKHTQTKIAYTLTSNKNMTRNVYLLQSFPTL